MKYYFIFLISLTLFISLNSVQSQIVNPPCNCFSNDSCVQNYCPPPFNIDYIENSPIYFNQSFQIRVFGSNLNQSINITVNGVICPIVEVHSYYVSCNAAPATTYNQDYQYEFILVATSYFKNQSIFSIDNFNCMDCESSNSTCGPCPPLGMCESGQCSPIPGNFVVSAISYSLLYYGHPFSLTIYGSGFGNYISVTIDNNQCDIYSIQHDSIECLAQPIYNNTDNIFTINITSPTQSSTFDTYFYISCANCNGVCDNGVCYNSSSSSESSGSSSSDDNSIVCNFNRYNQTISLINYSPNNVEITCNGTGYVNCHNNYFKCKSNDSYSSILCSSFNQITCYASNSISCTALDFQCSI